MLDTISLDPEMTTDALMRRWPKTIPVLIQHGMMCVGCPIAGFHTLTEACIQHEVEFESFMAALERTIAADAEEE